MRSLRRLSLSLLILSGAAAAQSAQRGMGSSPFSGLFVTDDRISRVERWLVAVDTHVPGREDAAVREILDWPNGDLSGLWVDVSVLSQIMRTPKLSMFWVELEGQNRSIQLSYTRSQKERLQVLACAATGMLRATEATNPCVVIHAMRAATDDLRRLDRHAAAAAAKGDRNYVTRRGALLHADAGMLMRDRPAEPVSASRMADRSRGIGRFRMKTADGRSGGVTEVPVHWEIGRMLIDAIVPAGADKPAPGRDEMARQWYVATASWMQEQADHDSVHLDRARAIFPKDPDVLFLSGCEHETYASPTIQNAMREANLPRGVRPFVDGDGTELHRAETFLRGALAARPDFGEARIRLGRVLALLDRHDEAAVELRTAIAPHDGESAYYRALFLGGEEEALGRLDAARDAYERAAILSNTAQSPWLGLSELARRRGDRGAALAALRHLFELPGDDSLHDDPLWTYHVDQARNTNPLLDALRKPFLEAEER
jgi:tetratricopeptide (TPR) repeat protein